MVVIILKELEKGSNGISIYGLNMLSTGLTLEKAKIKGFDAEEVEYSDKQQNQISSRRITSKSL